MGDGFSNPVTNAIGTLVRKVMQSVNYVAGIAGWAIFKDGSAEFNNATIRGQLQVGVSPNPRIIIGTAIPTELATWAAANNVTIGALIRKYWNATNYRWEGVGTFQAIPCSFSGTYDTVNGVYVIDRVLVVGAGDIRWQMGSYALNGFQFRIVTQQAFLQVGDGSFINDSFLPNVDAWHAITLQNGWGNFGGGFVTAQYRLSPMNSAVECIGVISGGTNASGTTVFTLPVNYRPLTAQRNDIYAFGATLNIATETPGMTVNTNGTVVLIATTNASILTFHFWVALFA